MKKWQFGSIFAARMLLVVFAACSTPTLLAQPQLTPAQLAALIPLDPTNLPFVGTYWFLIGPSPGNPCPPLPFPPDGMPDAPVYALGAGHYLVDDTLRGLRRIQAIDGNGQCPAQLGSPVWSKSRPMEQGEPSVQWA